LTWQRQFNACRKGKPIVNTVAAVLELLSEAPLRAILVETWLFTKSPRAGSESASEPLMHISESARLQVQGPGSAL
jgi:hypothetical protein